MVRKIQNSEYLKRYDNMTAGERQQYIERVGEWLRSKGSMLEHRSYDPASRLQNVLEVSASWNDEECQAFEEGALLMSAVANTMDTWLPEMLYRKATKRAVTLMVTVLHTVTGMEATKTAGPKEEAAEETRKGTQPVGGAVSASPDANATTATQPVPARPRHVDQYVHLLPAKTQERASTLKDLYTELDEARRKMDLLMEDETASPADREAWATKATSTDNRIRKILDELDAEWAKLVKQGRVTVDDLGNARIVEKQDAPEGQDAQASGEQAELTSEQKARRRELRKWLVDTRRGNGDNREEHVKKWQENFKEFLTFDGDAAYEDEKIREAARHYGIRLKAPKKK